MFDRKGFCGNLNNIHSKYKERTHKRHDQGKPLPVGKNGKQQQCSRNEKQQPVHSLVSSFDFHYNEFCAKIGEVTHIRSSFFCAVQGGTYIQTFYYFRRHVCRVHMAKNLLNSD